MTSESLHTLLRDLHRELESGGAVDDETRGMLETVLDDVRRVLADPGAVAASEQHTLAERLRDATRDLESSHPRLTATAEQLVESLSALFR